MASHSQTDLQRKIHEKKINIESDNYFGNLIAPYIVRRFSQYIATPLLDAGAGDGSFLKELRKSASINIKQLHGIDLVPNDDLGIIEGSTASLPYSNEEFKTIICSEVLEHLDTSTLIISLLEFTRVLRADGYLICTFPFDENLKKQTYTCPNCETSFHRFGHVQSWHSKSSVTKMFSDAHLKVLHFEILPLGAVAKLPWIRIFSPLLNLLKNPPGLRKRALIICQKKVSLANNRD